jgi:hypothetical protein
MFKLCLTFLLLAGFAGLFAQLSPGDLANAHKDLEGLENCTKCHEIGKKVAPEKCLACHVALNDRIKQDKGLHARKDYQNCAECHSDHHGREYELIWWKENQKNFDHAKTGYALEGKHESLQCRQCHQAKFILDQNLLQSQKKNPETTFLGLSTGCLNCHQDEHRGQLDNQCLGCHQMSAWKPAVNFIHNRSKFLLTGKHTTVPCTSCHKGITDQSQKSEVIYTQYTGLRFESCNGCHKDPHSGRLGSSCTNCHTTSAWQGVNNDRFDHDKTRFPLVAKHRSVQCSKCHTTSRSLQTIKFKTCSDCHADYHQRQFVNRPEKGNCEDCHTLQGFKPADFTISEHNQTEFPLAGGHLAVPCYRCHQKTDNGTERYMFPSTECIVCHSDPHQGTADQYARAVKSDLKQDKCAFCHSVDSWDQIHFDHSQTEFNLVGKHQSAKCSGCHLQKGAAGTNHEVKFKIAKKSCQDCHADQHLGQFTEKSAVSADITRCERCHSSVDWTASNFDHDRDSRFKLEGAHRKLQCAGCHKKNSDSPGATIIYKPLDTACSTCHGHVPVNQQGRPS